MQIGYALAKYGSSNRRISEPFPLGVTKTTDGLCLRKAGGQTQKGWNIKYVDIAGGAGGGSEAAGGPTPAGFLVYGPAAQLTAWGIGAAVGGIISDLQTATARSMYDHNQTQGIKFNMYLGADARSVNGVALSRVLPGSNDGAVAYHSQGGVSKRARYCNNGSQGCPDINYGNAKTETGDAKWSNHYVKHQDIDHKLSHFLNEKWEGVTSALLKDHLKK